MVSKLCESFQVSTGTLEASAHCDSHQNLSNLVRAGLSMGPRRQRVVQYNVRRTASTWWRRVGRSRALGMSALGIALMVVFASLGVVAPTAAGAATAPAFVQTKTNDIGSGTKATVAFTNANTAGNLIAVYV